jgi:archaetidylinositol phosphate synthase
MLEQEREKFKLIEEKAGSFFTRFGLSANHYTLISLFLVLVSFYFLSRAAFLPALLFFTTAALMDLVDGAVARFTQKASKKGAYLDTICDRYVEAVVLLGFLTLPLPFYFAVPAKVWIFIAFFGSLMTTYAKAAAKEKGLVKKELRRGLLGRGERMILIAAAMFLGAFNIYWTLYPIIVLAVLANFTALQRIYLSLSPR